MSAVDNTEGAGKSRRFLECVNDNFTIGMKEEPTRHDTGSCAQEQGGAAGEGGAPKEPWLQ